MRFAKKKWKNWNKHSLDFSKQDENSQYSVEKINKLCPKEEPLRGNKYYFIPYPIVNNLIIFLRRTPDSHAASKFVIITS